MRILLVIYLAAFTGCRIDPKINLPLSDCPRLEELIASLDDPGEFGNGNDGFISADSGMTYADFVSDNSNEIVSYYSGYLTSYNSSLVKFNLVSKEFETIFENPEILSLPELSNTNWLIFTGSNYQIWKIKIDGDSLTQLTSNGVNFEATWSPDGERFIYKQDYPIGTYNTIIADKNGNNLFSLNGNYKIRQPAWSPDGRYIACSNYSGFYTNIDLIDATTWEVQTLIEGEDIFTEQVQCIDFLPDSKSIIWATNTELRKTDIETGLTEVLSTTCDSQDFDEINISFDGKTILVKKTIYSYYDSKHLMLAPKVFLIDSQGNEINEIIF